MLSFIAILLLFAFAGMVASYLLWREFMLDKIAKRELQALKDLPAKKRGW